MKLKASQEYKPTIPTASMADIAFLLIIFFMLTITFEVDRTQVRLPKTQLRFEIPKKSAYVSIDSSRVIRVSDGEEIAVNVPGHEEVFSFAANLVNKFPDRAVVLKADGDVPYSEIDAVMDALKRGKVRLIYLLSDQRTIEG